jgi:hypothetical protein
MIDEYGSIDFFINEDLELSQQERDKLQDELLE